MAPLKSTRLAWSVALAALALWATSVPSTWGQVATGATRWFDDITPQQFDDSASDSAADPDRAPACPPVTLTVPPAVTAITPPALVNPPPPQPAAGDSQEGTFHLCGGDTSAAARAIEQLIAGRGVNSSLSVRGDGCADLTIRVTSPSTGGSATSRLQVSLGGGRNLAIQIVSERGATQVDIAPTS